MQISPNKNINLTSNQKYQPTFFNVKPPYPGVGSNNKAHAHCDIVFLYFTSP